MHPSLKADPETRDEIIRILRSSVLAYVTKDPQDYMRNLVPSDDLLIIGTGPDEIVHGDSAVRELLIAQLAELRSMTFEFGWMDVWRNGETAWLGGEMKFQGELLDGGRTQGSARCTAVFVLVDGRWLGVACHFSVPDSTPTNGGWWPHSVDMLASAVAYERPDLGQQIAPDGMATLLFTDIEESTQLNERLGDIRWMEVLREHNAIVRERIAAYNGCEVKTIGDAFMVSFSSARRAVLCATDLQRAFAAYNAENPETAMRIRVGLHAGEPVREGSDFFGRSVTEASRIVGEARGGEILVSSLLREMVESAGDIRFDGGRDVELKGLSGTRRVYAVVA